jgi:NADH-quinone oxidoreductase subunit C
VVLTPGPPAPEQADRTEVRGSRVGVVDLAATKRAVDSALAGLALSAARLYGDVIMADVPRERLTEAARIVRDHEVTRCDFISVIAGVDTGTQLGTVTIVHGTRSGVWVALRTWAPENDPRIPTLVEVWPGANWHEREAYDMFGIVFEGHPDPRRVFLEADFPGHPMRKSFMAPRSDARGG